MENLPVCLCPVTRSVLKLLCKKLQRRVCLLVVLAREPCWQSSVHQGSTVGGLFFFSPLRNGSNFHRLFVSRRAADNSFPACSADASGRHWSCSSARSEVVCSVDDGDARVSCRVEQHCPYAEERQPIQITIHVSSKHFLVESYSRRFYLSDIGETFPGADVLFWKVFPVLTFPVVSTVKPDKVKIRQVNATMVAWSYPSSWSGPFSYFPLAFQITQLKNTCTICEDPCAHSRATKVGVTANVGLDKRKKNAELSWGLWFFILDFNSQLSWNLPAWGEAEDNSRLY